MYLHCYSFIKSSKVNTRHGLSNIVGSSWIQISFEKHLRENNILNKLTSAEQVTSKLLLFTKRLWNKALISIYDAQMADRGKKLSED